MPATRFRLTSATLRNDRDSGSCRTASAVEQRPEADPSYERCNSVCLGGKGCRERGVFARFVLDSCWVPEHLEPVAGPAP